MLSGGGGVSALLQHSIFMRLIKILASGGLVPPTGLSGKGARLIGSGQAASYLK